MIDLIKNLVMQQLASKITGGASNAIAEQGAGAFINMFKEKLTGGGFGDLTAMLGGGGDAANGFISGFQDKLGSIMQEQGVSADEAAAQAGSVAPDVFNMVKEKFASSDPSTAGFDISALAGLAGGGEGLLGSAADMLKGNAGDLLGKAKDLF